MSSRLPFFSVIIPTHLRARFLKRALESIKSQISGYLVQVIVVSDVIDSATDLVCNALLGPHDIYIRRGGVPGPSESRNLGLTVASGCYVFFLDDDDAWHPDFIRQLSESTRLDSVVPLYFNCTVAKESRGSNVFEISSEVLLNQSGSLTQAVYIKNQIHMSCFVFPRGILRGLLFDTHMRAYEDWDFLLFAFDRAFPEHVDILGSRVFEVDDETSDRRGAAAKATDFNAVLDYLYVYRRHPGATEAIKIGRRDLLASVGLQLSSEML